MPFPSFSGTFRIFFKKDKQSFQLLDFSQLNSSVLQNQSFSSSIKERKETLRAEKQSGKSDLFYFYYLFVMFCRNSHGKIRSRQTAVSVAHLLLGPIYFPKETFSGCCLKRMNLFRFDSLFGSPTLTFLSSASSAAQLQIPPNS